jgi:hypothetical protein
MNSSHFGILVLAATLVTSTFANDAEFEVTLAPPEQIVKRGETLRFVVTVRAIASRRRVLKFGERGDFRDNYAQLVVTRNGERVEVPRAISDPGPIGEADYVQLALGEAVEFEHRGQPYWLAALPSGTYSAIVKVRADWKSDAVVSRPVSFTVE